MKGLKTIFSELKCAFSESNAINIWKGKTENNALNRTSFGARSALGFFGAALFMANAKSRPLAGLMLASSSILREGVGLMFPSGHLIYNISELEDSNEEQGGFAPILRTVEMTVGLHALWSLIGGIKGKVGVGKLLPAIITFGGTAAWNGYLFSYRTSKPTKTNEEHKVHLKDSSEEPAVKQPIDWKRRLGELFDFPLKSFEN